MATVLIFFLVLSFSSNIYILFYFSIISMIKNVFLIALVLDKYNNVDLFKKYQK